MKERSSSYAQALLLALLMLQACSSSESDRQVGTPAPVRMKFHQLKVEPQVHSSYPTYRRYHDGLAPQVVVIRVDGLEQNRLGGPACQGILDREASGTDLYQCTSVRFDVVDSKELKAHLTVTV